MLRGEGSAIISLMPKDRHAFNSSDQGCESVKETNTHSRRRTHMTLRPLSINTHGLREGER